MRDADRRIGLVHVLAARARCAVRVDPQVVLVDLDPRCPPGKSGAATTCAKAVWRRWALSNGLRRTSRCTPRSALKSP
jgi:hypothetical protein